MLSLGFICLSHLAGNERLLSNSALQTTLVRLPCMFFYPPSTDSAQGTTWSLIPDEKRPVHLIFFIAVAKSKNDGLCRSDIWLRS